MKRREEKSITLLTNILSFKLLIALLSILLFLISCKSNENPNAPKKPPRKKHELEGTWVGYDNKDKDYELKFTVDSDGNITFSPRPYPYIISPGNTNLRNYLYIGKVKTNDIVYPYTNDVTCDLLNRIGEEDGKFVFSNQSNCTAKYNRIDAGNNPYIEITIITNGTNITTNTNNVGGYLGLAGVTVEFTKQ